MAMRSLGILCLMIVLVALGLGQNAPSASPPSGVNPLPLSFDAEIKEVKLKEGELSATFTFHLTNTSSTPVVIENVSTSCGCSTPVLPSKPWTLDPGDHGELLFEVDLRGKRGTLVKTAVVFGPFGSKLLTMKVQIPPSAQDSQAGSLPNDRNQNMMLARADRQAIFKGDCARCHVEPGRGKTGEALYKAVCGICHEAEHRASMVTDLSKLQKPTTREYWIAWISYGKKGSLMPAFKQSEGGPLNDEEIKSLADFLAKRYPGNIRVFKVE